MEENNNEEEPLTLLYDAIVEGKSLDRIHFWRSDVHYARAAIEAATGIRLTLEKTHKYLVEEGLLRDSER